MNKYHVPDWKLERYLLGELPKGDFEAVRALERESEELRERAAALRASDAEILAKYPPAQMAEKIRRMYTEKQGFSKKTLPESVSAAESGVRGKSSHTAGHGFSEKPVSVDKSRGWRHWDSKNFSRWAIPALACAAVLVVIPMRVINTGAPSGNAGSYDNGIRYKGITPGIEVWRKEGESAQKLAPKAVARTGDIVQLRYIVPEPCYGMLVSVDGRGVLTVHLSGDSGKAAPLTPGRPIALNSSYQLDDAPLFEAFYLITAPESFDLDGVTRTLQKAQHPIGEGKRGLSLPKKQRVTAFTLSKSQEIGMNSK